MARNPDDKLPRRDDDVSLGRDVVAELHVLVAPLAVGDKKRASTLADQSGDHRVRARLQAVVASAVAEHLGPEFQVREVNVWSGSLELVAAIVLVGKVVMTYSAVRDGLQNILTDVRSAARVAVGVAAPGSELFVERDHLATWGHYRLGPAMEKFPVEIAAEGASQRDTVALPPVALWLGLALVILLLLGLLLTVVLVEVL